MCPVSNLSSRYLEDGWCKCCTRCCGSVRGADLAGDFHGPLLGEAVFNQLVEKKLTFAACSRDLKLLLDEAAS
ncbi:hypothetical protein Nepgr_012419 [Nepenthes gracilis]|uniref:Uncharacterized protein n=1 Tax=Nepenthes gracilis TaxID=150966 RepID=A0AAD3SFY4_NEPGR|nr:hypothetical protein Nepgr_012419 [Nepenthes gracilis]